MTLTKHKFNILPLMQPEEYEQLKDSIRAEGYDEDQPIVLYDGAVLDGWNRYHACLELGVEYVCRHYEGMDEDALRFVMRSNNRRNLTSSQRACFAHEAKAMVAEIKERARLRQIEAGVKYGECHPKDEQELEELIPQALDSQSPTVATPPPTIENPFAPDPPRPMNSSQRAVIAYDASEEIREEIQEPKATRDPQSRDTIAAMFGTNPRYIQDAERISETAPDTYERIKAGEISIIEANKIERDKARAKANAELAAQIATAPNAPTVSLASYADWLPTQPQCDLLLTDPPYSKDVDDINAFAADWLPMALAKLKPTGRAYVFIGAYPEELQAYLNTALPTQILVWTYRNTLGPTPKYDYIRNLQYILYYRGEEAPPLQCPNLMDQISVLDFCHPARSANRFHQWQKPDEIANRFVQHATQPGDIILDPFCCTGTFPLAAARYDRIGKGCDIDAANLEIAKERGCNVE